MATQEAFTQSGSLNVEQQISERPDTFIYKVEAGSMVTDSILDAARIGIYQPDRFADAKLRAQQVAFNSYLDGGLELLSEEPNSTTQTLIDRYIDQEIAIIQANIESGIDRSLFEVQLDSIRLMADQLAKAHTETREAQKQLAQKNVAALTARLSLIQTNKLTAEELITFEKQMGIYDLLHKTEETLAEKSEAETAVGSATAFEAVIDGSKSFRANALDKTRLVEPPQSAEVPHVNAPQKVA